MYLALMVGNFVEQDVRERCRSTLRPLLPTMTDLLLAPSGGGGGGKGEGVHFCGSQWNFRPTAPHRSNTAPKAATSLPVLAGALHTGPSTPHPHPRKRCRAGGAPGRRSTSSTEVRRRAPQLMPEGRKPHVRHPRVARPVRVQ